MKRSLSLLLALIMLIGILPFQVFADVESAELETKIEETEEGAEEKSPLVQEDVEEDELQIGDEIKGVPVGEGEITLNRKGQWINESKTYQEEELKQYASENDIIGEQATNGGLLRGLAKQFLAWSDLPPVDNGVLSEGAKLFLPQDTVKSYQDYVKGMKAKKGSEYTGDENTIYAVYYELNGFGNPFNDWQTGSLGNVASQLASNINNNKVMINNNVKADDVLKATDIDKVEETDTELKIIDKYKKTDDDKTINEVVLNSEFEMDWVVAMLAYRNMIGSNQLRPILARNDFKRYEKNQFIDKSGDVKVENIEGFSTLDGKNAGYTYVDLNMDFGEDGGLVVPEKLFLEFKSYSWRPLFAYGEKEGGEKEILNIFGVDGSSKGNKPDAFKEIVSKKDPSTKFGVETNNYRKITVRVVLRKWGGKDVVYKDDRIEESYIPVGPDGTRASELLSNMTLRVLGSADGIENKNIVRITDSKAKELADGEAKEDIDVKGSIQGHVFADAGTVKKGWFTINLRSNTGIDFSEAEKVLKLSYVHEKEEPKPIEKVVLTLDENHFDGKILTHELDKCEEVGKYLYNPSREGYIFRGWNTKSDGSGDFVKASDLICESKTIYAIWEKEAVEHHHEYVPTLPVYADAKKDNVRPSESHSAYIFGYEDKSVRANGNLTRAEAAAMVTRLANLDLSNKAKADYKDLQDKAWYLPYINAALKAGMIDADGENLRPNDKITRAEFAKMLAAIDKENDYVSKFEDVKGHKYEKEINKIDGNKRIAGYEDGTFRPDNNLTRAEAASFLNRMFNRVADDVAIRNLEDSIVKFTDLNKGDWFYYEIVEAANSHELVRRDGSDKYDRVYESWLRLIDNGITR